MALVTGVHNNRPLHGHRHEKRMGVWLRCLTLAAFCRTAREHVNAAKSGARQWLQHTSKVDVPYKGNPTSLVTPLLDEGCVQGVFCKHSSRYHTPRTQQAGSVQATRDKASELPNRQSSVPSSSSPRKTRSKEGRHCKRDRLRVEKIKDCKKPPLQQGAVSDVNFSHSVPTQNDGYQILRGTNDKPVKSLRKCQGSTRANSPTLPMQGVTQETLSNVGKQHAQPQQHSRRGKLSTAIRRMQHPVASFRGDVMQQSIGQGAGVSSLHQRAAILQRQNLIHVRSLPLLAGRREPSPEVSQPAGQGRMDMYRQNQLDWLSGLPNIGLF